MAPGAGVSLCKGCGAEVIFVPSAKSGKPMILDAKPTKGIVLVYADEVLAPGNEPDPRARVSDVYTDHHATCPKAADFRRERVLK